MCTPTLFDHTWRLVALSDIKITNAELMKAKANIRLEEEGKVYGHGGCNRFFGSCQLREGGIKFGALASTRMYCIETMAVEDAYFSALAKVERWSVNDDELLLRSEDDSTWLKFKIGEEVDKQKSNAGAKKKNARKPRKDRAK